MEYDGGTIKKKMVICEAQKFTHIFWVVKWFFFYLLGMLKLLKTETIQFWASLTHILIESS